MRRIGIALFCLLLAPLSYAGNYGFYGGVGLGFGMLQIDNKFNIDAPPSPDSILLFNNDDLSRGFVSQFRVGYANGYPYERFVPHWWDRFHWAVEAFFDPQSHSVTTNAVANDASVDYHLKFNYGVVLKPGIQTTLNTTLQLHLGVTRAEFARIDTNPAFLGYEQIGNQGKGDTGWRLGLGLEGRLNRRMSIEVAVMRTFFSNKSTERILTPFIPVDGITYTIEKLTFKPRLDQVLMNFNYYLIR